MLIHAEEENGAEYEEGLAETKASILCRSAFFTVHLSHLYMTTGKTIVLTRLTFVGKVMFLLFNMLSRLVIAFLPRNKCLNFMASVLPMNIQH